MNSEKLTKIRLSEFRGEKSVFVVVTGVPGCEQLLIQGLYLDVTSNQHLLEEHEMPIGCRAIISETLLLALTEE